MYVDLLKQHIYKQYDSNFPTFGQCLMITCGNAGMKSDFTYFHILITSVLTTPPPPPPGGALTQSES